MDDRLTRVWHVTDLNYWNLTISKNHILEYRRYNSNVPQ